MEEGREGVESRAKERKTGRHSRERIMWCQRERRIEEEKHIKKRKKEEIVNQLKLAGDDVRSHVRTRTSLRLEHIL